MTKQGELVVLAEECGELIQAACKMQRLLSNDPTLRDIRGVEENLKEELVDVTVAIKNVIEQFGYDEFELGDMFDAKLKRTEELDGI